MLHKKEPRVPGPSSVASAQLIHALPLRIIECLFIAMPSPNCSILCHCWSIQCKSFAAQLDSVLCNSPANLIRGMQFLSGSTQCYALANLCEAFRSPCTAAPCFAIATLFTSWLSLCKSVRSMLVNAIADQCGARPFRAVPWPCSISFSMPLPFIAPFGPAVPLQCLALPFRAFGWLRLAFSAFSQHFLSTLCHCSAILGPSRISRCKSFLLYAVASRFGAFPCLCNAAPFGSVPGLAIAQLIAVMPLLAFPSHCAAPRGRTMPLRISP